MSKIKTKKHCYSAIRYSLFSCFTEVRFSKKFIKKFRKKLFWLRKNLCHRMFIAVRVGPSISKFYFLCKKEKKFVYFRHRCILAAKNSKNKNQRIRQHQREIFLMQHQKSKFCYLVVAHSHIFFSFFLLKQKI